VDALVYVVTQPLLTASSVLMPRGRGVVCRPPAHTRYVQEYVAPAAVPNINLGRSKWGREGIVWKVVENRTFA
jgi:hypothetical protein